MTKYITKKQFLNDHNKLSPPELQATFTMLTRFQQDKKPSLKDDGWSMDKLRIPLIAWLSASTREKNKDKNNQSGYRNYPETKLRA